jgi:hypothetical protein
MANYEFVEIRNGDSVETVAIIIRCDFHGGGNNWPGGMETDADQICVDCGELVRAGLNPDGDL